MSILSSIGRSETRSAVRQFLFGDPAVVKLVRVLISIDLIFMFVHGIKFIFKEEFIA